MSIEQILAPYQTFGVNLGLERIQLLLSRLGNPHHRVSIIHVAGTNGKGSVCAYLSSILTTAGYRTGRYTSPHLVDWTERLVLQEQAIALPAFEDLLHRVIHAIDPAQPQLQPTIFELVTAAAWLYFAEQRVAIAVMEVGLGGRLDATNVCDRPLITMITSLSRDHWQRLGPTLAHIAAEKAGILKPLRPAIIGELPPEATLVIRQQLQDLRCPADWIHPATPVPEREGWVQWQGLTYPLPLPGAAQRQNSALALGAIMSLRRQGWQISDTAIVDGIQNTEWPGRLQWLTWRSQPLLIDGAHNVASAQVLRDYLDSLPAQPTQWFIGMLATKDHREILQILLRPGDRLALVPVPDHASATPAELRAIAAKFIVVESCDCFDDLFTALEQLPREEFRAVLCGSLYLIGHFCRHTYPQELGREQRM